MGFVSLAALSDSTSEVALLEGKATETGVIGTSEPSGIVGMVRFSLSSPKSRKFVISIGGGRLDLDKVSLEAVPLWFERAFRESVEDSDGDEGIGGRGPFGGRALIITKFSSERPLVCESARDLFETERGLVSLLDSLL